MVNGIASPALRDRNDSFGCNDKKSQCQPKPSVVMLEDKSFNDEDYRNIPMH